MKKILILLVFAVTVPRLILAQTELKLKKRVAVVDFDDRSATQQTYTLNGQTYTTGGSQGASRKLTDMLTTALSKSGVFQVVERSQLQKVVDEQNLGNSSGTVSPQSAAQAGKIMGIQFIVTGSVTEYGQKNDVHTQSYLYWSTTKGTIEARVAVDVRLINSNTGEILIAESAVGVASSQVKGNTLKSQSTTDNTLLDQATRLAIDSCVRVIKKGTAKIAWEGRVIKVNQDGSLIIKPGSTGGVTASMALTVYSKGDDVIDPDTGLSLGSEAKKTATITVVSDIGDGAAAQAKIATGGNVKAGDIIRIN